METVKNEFWEPLPPEVAEWMGAAAPLDPPADAADPIAVPASRGIRERLKHLLDLTG